MNETTESPFPVVLQVLPALDGGGVERGTVEVTQAITRAGGTALVASAADFLNAGYDHLLFSFHGLPERHLRKGHHERHEVVRLDRHGLTTCRLEHQGQGVVTE